MKIELFIRNGQKIMISEENQKKSPVWRRNITNQRKTAQNKEEAKKRLPNGVIGAIIKQNQIDELGSKCRRTK